MGVEVEAGHLFKLCSFTVSSMLLYIDFHGSPNILSSKGAL